MTVQLDKAMAEIVDALTAAGVRASADERDMNPPAAYVSVRRLAWDRLAGYSMDVAVYAVVPNTGRLPALAALGPMVEQIRAVWPAASATAEDLYPLDSGDPLPAFRFDLSVTVDDDD